MARPEVFAVQKALPPVPAGPDGTKVVLPLRVPKRGRDLWCWAAVGVAVGKAYGDPPLQQCELATIVFAGEGYRCCATPKLCDKKQPLPPALRSHHDRFETSKLTIEFVRRRIKKRHPIPIRLQSDVPKEGHFVLITGFWTDRFGRDCVVVCDPANGRCGDHLLDAVLTEYRFKWRWHFSFVTKGTPVL